MSWLINGRIVNCLTSILLVMACVPMQQTTQPTGSLQAKQYASVMERLRKKQIVGQFKDEPLGVVVDRIENAASTVGVQVFFNWRQLRDRGVDQQTKINISRNSNSVAELLEEILKQSGTEADIGYEYTNCLVVSSRYSLPFRDDAVVTTPLNDKSEAKRAKYRIRPTSDPSAPFGVYVPKDLVDCFSELRRSLTSEYLDEFKHKPEKTAVSEVHFGLGMWIRNNWALWKGSRLYDYFKGIGIEHPDDMSGIILTSLHRQLNNLPIALEAQIEDYKRYWRDHQENDVSLQDDDAMQSDDTEVMPSDEDETIPPEDDEDSPPTTRPSL